MKYLVYRIDEKGQLDIAGIYDIYNKALDRLEYVEDNFTFGKGEWELEAIPDIDIDANSVLLLNKKD